MSLESLLSTNDITIAKPSSDTTRYKDKAVDWNFVRSLTPTTGWLTQISTSEEVGARQVVTTGWKLYLRVGEDIAAADRILVGDCETYEVDGDPALHQTPRGAHHIECVLRRVADWRPL